MNIQKIITGSLIILGCGLAACNKDNASAHAIYNCENNTTLDVTFKGGKSVRIGIRSTSYDLDRMEGEAGAKYSNEVAMFSSMGVDAQFSEKPGSKPLRCKRN